MKITIDITNKNKDKIIKLIEQILEEEDGYNPPINKINDFEPTSTHDYIDYLSLPSEIAGLRDGKVVFYISNERLSENQRMKSIGSWGQFNSFFPIKASLRILANYMVEKDVSAVKLDEFVKVCVLTFNKRKLNKKRGFPSSNKDTAKGRFVWHFLSTAYEMGLISIAHTDLKYDGFPKSFQDWDKIEVDLTNQGMKFALLPNNIFDNISDTQVLTDEEKKWIKSYLKNINDDGFGEYDLLRKIYLFLSEGNDGKNDLFDWFKNNKDFTKYIKSWSRKAERNDEAGLIKQIETLSTSFAGSKIALLREMGVVNNRRNDYSIIGEM